MSRSNGESRGNGPATVYLLHSNQSSARVSEDVEMAHDEVH